MTRALTLVAAGAVTLALVIGASYLLGGRDARQGADINDLRDAAATRERIDNADVSTGDPGNDRDWVDQFLDGMRSKDQ